MKQFREWQSLDDDEIEKWAILKAPPIHPDFKNDEDYIAFARAIEYELRKKNHGI